MIPVIGAKDLANIKNNDKHIKHINAAIPIEEVNVYRLVTFETIDHEIHAMQIKMQNLLRTKLFSREIFLHFIEN